MIIDVGRIWFSCALASPNPSWPRIPSPAEASRLTWASKEKAWQHGNEAHGKESKQSGFCLDRLRQALARKPNVPVALPLIASSHMELVHHVTQKNGSTGKHGYSIPYIKKRNFKLAYAYVIPNNLLSIIHHVMQCVAGRVGIHPSN